MKFFTNILISLKDEKEIKSLGFENIKLNCEKEPTGRYFQSLDGKSHTTCSARSNDFRKGQIPFKILIIETKNEEIAEDFISVLLGSLLIIFPDVSIINQFNYLHIFDKKYYDKDFIDYKKLSFTLSNNMSKALKMTAFCITDNNLVYALEKYKISLHLFSFNPISADPRYGNLFNNYSIKREQHTNQAFAIISAFSVIEELGLEIRSSSKNIRFLDKKEGIWNPVVLNNIIHRLKEVNISEEITFDWIFRGGKTNVENELVPYFGYNSAWCEYGEEVRDKTLTFPEAIHNASYLRNYIAAHKFNDLTKHINPYDVFNIQNLARKLFLERTSFW